MAHQGNFFVIEGTDGSGKGTQFQLLKNRLEQAGYDVATFDFPQYDQQSSYFVRQYLNGHYGSAEEVGPYTGSLFYALDRYEAAPAIRQALHEGKIVLANRFTGSNMAHQGTKFRNAEERRGYFIWVDNIEFQMLGIPRPDLNFVLRVPADIAQQLVDQKEARSYTDKKRDLHEADIEHLERAVEVYDDLCNLFPKDFSRLDCVRGGALLDIDTVSNLLWEKVQPLLPPVTPQSKRTLKQTTTQKPPHKTATANPYIKKLPSGSIITNAGYEYLNNIVTNTDTNVYAFKETMSPNTIAAAIARLSRRGDDLRLTIVEEFANAAGKDEELLKRVISSYGDDSVQQLTGIHLVVENCTKLMTNKLEWGRLAAYLEQSTRYIYFDERNEHGKYRYYTPDALDEQTAQTYDQIMDQIFDNYSQMVHELTKYVADSSETPAKERDAAWKNAVRAQACDAARLALPAATTTTVGIYASAQALEQTITRLLADELPEAQHIGQQLLHEARQVIPAFLERADMPERGGAITAYRSNTRQAVKQLANAYVPQDYANESSSAVTLTDINPRNELDLVPDMLYEHTDRSLSALRDDIAEWSYDKKAEVFTTYVGERLNRRHKPGRAFEKAQYSWDVVCDFGIFCDLMRHRIVNDLAWQALTPRYGYEMPDLIDEAGLSDTYEANFDLSLKLYSVLQQAGYQLEAQYATLLGHRMRWKVTYNAREAFHIHELRTSPQGHPGYRKLVNQMHEALAVRHPLTAEVMKFVNQGEDPKLNRLNAERYAQFKLQRQNEE